MEENNIVKSYVEYLNLKNLSKITIKEYCINLKVFFDFIINYYNCNIEVKDINIFLIAEVNSNTLLKFLGEIKSNRDIGISSLNRYSAAIKSFFKWLYVYSDYAKDTLKGKNNPAEILQNSSKAKRLPKYLDKDVAMKIQTIFTKENTSNYIRNNAIIIMFLTTGIRLNELYSLNIKDIDFERKQGKVIRKGNKEGTIYLSEKTVNHLKEYLNTRKDNCEALFVNYNNTRLSKRSIEEICEQAFELCGVGNKRYTVHTLRHTAATYMYQSTKDILIVKEFLGHENIKATEIYTHIDNSKARNAVNSNPLSKFKIYNTKRRKGKSK